MKVLKKEVRMANYITKIETQKKNKNRVSIFIDKKYAFGIYKKTLMKFELETGMILTPELIEEIKVEDEYKKCFNSALNYLSYRSRTSDEIRKKMLDKEYGLNTITKVIKELKRLNYIDDLDYSKQYIEYKKKKMGRRRIRYELERKGIDSRVIEQALLAYNSGKAYDQALRIAEKKNNQYGDISYQKRYNRLAGLLNRRGFSYDIIKNVLSEILSDYKRDYYN